ncbi:MAG TPA: hypothetical protein VFZ69_10785 [Longimicrobiales bacterium]
MKAFSTPFPKTALVAALAALAACSEREITPTSVETLAAQAHASHPDPVTDPEIARWLAGVREATAKFQRFEEAASAGWGQPVLDCMVNPGVGSQGQHYINGAVMTELNPEEFAPELLMYEPQKNGRQRLIGVEWAVPIDVWGSEPPVLHGVEFHQNTNLGLWVLHAWIWKHNPAGMFADWNPDVTCAYAPQP